MGQAANPKDRTADVAIQKPMPAYQGVIKLSLAQQSGKKKKKARIKLPSI